MKPKFKIIISISVFIVLGLIIYFVFLANQDKKPDFIKAELDKLTISVKEEAEKSADFLDNYDPTILSQLCSEAGYDYQPYLGKKMDFVSASDNFAEAYKEFSKAGDNMNFMGAGISSLLSDLPGAGKLKSAKNLVEAGKLMADAGQAMSDAMGSCKNKLNIKST